MSRSRFWGSAGESAAATIDDVPVEVDVAVGDDNEIRIAAWSEDYKTTVELILTEREATKVRDLLNTAFEEGEWLV